MYFLFDYIFYLNYRILMALNLNQTQLDSYNKGTTKGKGTLINNWYEESSIRNETGEGRTVQS
jgi:hypothetical protein